MRLSVNPAQPRYFHHSEIATRDLTALPLDCLMGLHSQEVQGTNMRRCLTLEIAITETFTQKSNRSRTMSHHKT